MFSLILLLILAVPIITVIVEKIVQIGQRLYYKFGPEDCPGTEKNKKKYFGE